MPKPHTPITLSPTGDSSLKPFVRWFLTTGQFCDLNRVKMLSAAITQNAWNLCGEMRMFAHAELPNGRFLLVLTPEGADDILSQMPPYCALPPAERLLVLTEIVSQFTRFAANKSVDGVVTALLVGSRTEMQENQVGRNPCTDYLMWICANMVQNAAASHSDTKAFEVDAFDVDGRPQYALTRVGASLLLPPIPPKSSPF